MGCFTIVRAVFVRILFTAHGLFSIWRLYVVTSDANHWYLTTALMGLLLETAVTLYKKRGQEWKWFCPSVFFYLLCLVPTIWFLELDELEKRIRENDARNITTIPTCRMPSTTLPMNDEMTTASSDDDESRAKILNIMALDIQDIQNRDWVRTLEQLLLLILIMGRWLLPKGKLTHDQLSQLLLVYIGTAADIVEFFEAFNEEKVKYNRDLCKVILGIWSWSVLQFTLVFTATKAPRREGVSTVSPAARRTDSCCTADVFGIIMSIFMQDGPFLVLRLLLIFKYSVTSYTNMFFTCKNTLVCMLLMYRLIVIQVERYKTMRLTAQEGAKNGENTIKAKLMVITCNSDQFYNYSTKVNLRDFPNNCEQNGQLVPFTIMRHVSLAATETEGGDSEDTRTLASEPGICILKSQCPQLSSKRRAGSCSRLTDAGGYTANGYKTRGRRMAIDMGICTNNMDDDIVSVTQDKFAWRRGRRMAIDMTAVLDEVIVDADRIIARGGISDVLTDTASDDSVDDLLSTFKTTYTMT